MIALPKLQVAGLVPEDIQVATLHGELTLYRLLRKESGNAYTRYNALIRELVSFERALAIRIRRRTSTILIPSTHSPNTNKL